MEKYHWTTISFSQIDWRSHSKAFKSTSPGQKVTLTKYLHGWLATKRRRYREGYSPTEQCALCQQSEDRLHLFRCSNPQITEIRRIAWTKFRADFCQGTESSFQAVFQEGLQTVMGGLPPTDGTREDWPKELR